MVRRRGEERKRQERGRAGRGVGPRLEIRAGNEGDVEKEQARLNGMDEIVEARAGSDACAGADALQVRGSVSPCGTLVGRQQSFEWS